MTKMEEVKRQSSLCSNYTIWEDIQFLLGEWTDLIGSPKLVHRYARTLLKIDAI